jgi:hypothetical protein
MISAHDESAASREKATAAVCVPLAVYDVADGEDPADAGTLEEGERRFEVFVFAVNVADHSDERQVGARNHRPQCSARRTGSAGAGSASIRGQGPLELDVQAR